MKPLDEGKQQRKISKDQFVPLIEIIENNDKVNSQFGFSLFLVPFFVQLSFFTFTLTFFFFSKSKEIQLKNHHIPLILVPNFGCGLRKDISDADD